MTETQLSKALKLIAKGKELIELGKELNLLTDTLDVEKQGVKLDEEIALNREKM